MAPLEKVTQIIERLRAASGASWVDKPWDGLQTGSLEAPVSGIAVLWAPALHLLKQAVERGCNLILTKDPVYWYEKEEPLRSVDSSTSRISEGIAGGLLWDAVEKSSAYRAKKEFIDAHQLNIYRLSENWDGAPSRSTEGLLQALGWKAQSTMNFEALNPQKKTAIVTVPAQELLQVAKAAKSKLGAKAARLIGNPAAKVSKIAVHPAYMTVEAMSKVAQVPGVDMVVTGEACEWEAFPYAQDWIAAGHGKGFLMLGLAVTSDTAANAVADWVRKVNPGFKVEALHAGDPFTPALAGRNRG